jgi:uncharacterized membrane protein
MTQTVANIQDRAQTFMESHRPRIIVFIGRHFELFLRVCTILIILSVFDTIIASHIKDEYATLFYSFTTAFMLFVSMYLLVHVCRLWQLADSGTGYGNIFRQSGFIMIAATSGMLWMAANMLAFAYPSMLSGTVRYCIRDVAIIVLVVAYSQAREKFARRCTQ